VAKCYGTYDELLTDPEIDVVYVSTLNPFHKEPVVKALRSGTSCKPLSDS
jgi:predicted dehydrogenase